MYWQCDNDKTNNKTEGKNENKIDLFIDDRISGNKHDNQVNNFKMHCFSIFTIQRVHFAFSSFFFYFSCLLFFYRSKWYLIKWRPQSLHDFIFALTAFIFTVYHFTQLIHLFVLCFLYVFIRMFCFYFYFFSFYRLLLLLLLLFSLL